MKEYVVKVPRKIVVRLNPENYASVEDLKAAIIHEAEVEAGVGFGGEGKIVDFVGGEAE